MTGDRGYLEHLSDQDLGVLAGVPLPGGGRAGVDQLRSSADLVIRLLRQPAAFDAVLGPATGREPLLHASPFLVFALAVHRCGRELETATFVEEWLAPGRWVASFDVDDLRGFLADPGRTLFLAQLLSSYTHVTSGSILLHTARGWRRRRYSDLDPVRLASILEAVPVAERVGIYRRLGDLALFLTGVFPDHTATRAFGPVDAGRLLRSALLAGEELPAGGLPTAVARPTAVTLLEQLGSRWYLLACQTAAAPTAAMQVVEEVAGRFSHARRILNLVTERHLFRFRERWFPAGG